MISPEIIEEIKYRNDIESIISSYVTLKRAGSNYSGLCPFHSEKTPSFVVFPATQSFYCFGCGAGGDAISFVMRAENIDYITAVRLIASRSGINIPENIENKTPNTVSRQRVLDMNKEAARFFHKCLLDENIGRSAREYLFEKRKLSGAIIKRFGLGYAPNSFASLHDHLKKLGYTDKEMVSAFLCGVGKNGSAYDYFRNRVIFPIIDVSGNIVAFGGRVLDNSEPKYLNTSDTPAFKKSKNLFALNFAKSNCEKELILCEGYMDVIALHEAGFENAVATLGTAITSEQARIFSRYTKKVVISYDSDSAGQRAADKAFRLLQEVGIDVKILKLSGAKDPDEFIKKFGPSKFADIINESKSRFEFEYDKITAKYNLMDYEDKIKASAEICRVIATFPSEIEREIYCQKASKALDIPQQSMKKDIQALIYKSKKNDKKTQKNEIYRSSSGIGDRINPESASNIRASKIEEAILGLMQLHSDNIGICLNKLKPDDFVTAFNRRVFEKISEAYNAYGKFDIAYVSEDFKIDEISRITKMLVDRQQLNSNGADVLEACIESLISEKKNNEDKNSLDSLQNLISRKK